jgi:hypothetical protein
VLSPSARSHNLPPLPLGIFRRRLQGDAAIISPISGRPPSTNASAPGETTFRIRSDFISQTHWCPDKIYCVRIGIPSQKSIVARDCYAVLS